MIFDVDENYAIANTHIEQNVNSKYEPVESGNIDRCLTCLRMKRATYKYNALFLRKRQPIE